MAQKIDLKRRIFPRVLFLFILAGSVIGCTPLHVPNATSTISATQTPKATRTNLPTLTPSPTSIIQLNDKQLQGVSIQFWHPYSGEVGATLDQLADEFSRQNLWQIKIENENINGIDLLRERVEAAIGQNKTPSLVILPLYQALGWNLDPALLIDWSMYVEDNRWGLPNSEKELYYPNLWEASLVNGHRWGIPARRVAQLLLYNASLASELGYSAAPKTLMEFQKQACSIPSDAAQDDTYPTKGYLFTHDYPTILAWLKAFGAKIESRELKSYQFKSSEVREAFIYLRKLYEQGCTLNVADIDPIEIFAQRQALFVSVNSGQIEVVEQAMQNAANRDLWTVLPFPTTNGDGVVVFYGTDFVLLRSSEQEQLAAWLFVRWLLEPENQKRLAENTYNLPLRSDISEELQQNSSLPAGYRAVLAYIPMGHNEPMMASWDTVRWAVGDASRQLLAWYFTLDQVPSLVELLDKTAADLNARRR
ncbi:MAG: extracellular solute-binding protein [Anaerolineales bacterium]|nr:extracellular solute-binding protein [Anaerolineales bacterium]